MRLWRKLFNCEPKFTASSTLVSFSLSHTHSQYVAFVILTVRNRAVEELGRWRLVHNRRWHLCVQRRTLAAKHRQPDQSKRRSSSMATLETFVPYRLRDFLQLSFAFNSGRKSEKEREREQKALCISLETHKNVQSSRLLLLLSVLWLLLVCATTHAKK